MALGRKPKWLLTALAALLLGLAAIWFLWPPDARITWETYQIVHLGMSHSEVEAMLGGPGASRQDCVLWMDNRSPVAEHGVDLVNEHRNQPGIEYWFQDSGIIVLRFDADHRVADKQFLGVPVSTLRQTIRRARERMGW